MIAVALLSGCGGGSSPQQEPLSAPVSVTVAPPTSSVQVGLSQSFTATVANDSSNKGVTWSLSGTGCTGAACGTVAPTSSASGVAVTYTAPSSVPNPASVILTATITVSAPPGPVSVTITPKRGGLVLGQSLNLTATVTNDVAAAGVTWTP